MDFLDKFFSALPLLLISFYFLNAFTDLNSYKTVKFLLFGAAASSFLKLLIRKKRRQKSFVFIPWQASDRLRKININYGFPSSHTVFYASHFFINPGCMTMILLLLGIFFRISYQHHTRDEVLCSILVTFMLYKVYNLR